MIKTLKRGWAENPSLAFFLGLLLGFFAFLSIYGPLILRPGYEDWLLATGGDTGQHYLGWTFFRSAPWHFPPGLHNGLTYPEWTSVLFTDSFPVYALFFKLLSPLLPSVFQYFGIAGCVCFMLQGGFAMLLFRKKSDSPILCVLASLFFVYAPILIFRMYAHTSLASQWMILAALALWQYGDDLRFRSSCILWGGLFFLLPLTHPYFIPMIFLIFCGYWIESLVRRKGARRYVCLPLLCVLAAALSMYLVGAFYGGVETTVAQNVDYHNANLNTFFNPQQFGKVLREREAGAGQYEGAGYLGFGLLLLCFLSFYLFLQEKLPGPRGTSREAPKTPGGLFARLGGWLRAHLRGALTFLVFLAAFTLALGTRVSFGSKELFSFHPPDLILRLWSVFRATGRFIWVCWYILAFSVLSFCIRRGRRGATAVVLLLCLAVQLYDITPYMQRDSRFRQEIQAESRLKSEAWQTLGEESAHLFLFSEQHADVEVVLNFAKFADRYGLTMNDFHFARTVSQEEQWRRRSEALAAPRADTLYVFLDQGAVWTAQETGMEFFSVDGFLIGLWGRDTGKTPGLLTPDLSVLHIPLGQRNTLENGTLEGTRRILFPGGLSYGPWWTVPNGSYQVEITGGNLENAQFLMLLDGLTFLPEDQYHVDAREDRLTASFTLSQPPGTTVEFLVTNGSEEPLWMESMVLRRNPPGGADAAEEK